MRKVVEEASKRLKFKFPYNLDEWSESLVMENYHKHTTWSDFVQIDSATSIEDFMKKSEECGCKMYFSTEHGYPGEWLHCYNLCKNSPLEFRYGAEVYWVKDKDAEIEKTYIDKKGEEKIRVTKDNMNCHMVLIARNYNAIRKLNYIISCAHVDGFYYKPRIDLKLLHELKPEDVYVTSACFTSKMMVQTKNGYKRIDSIHPGEMVLTHLNTWEPVVCNTRRIYDDDLYFLNIEGCSDLIECTKDHLFPTVQKTHNDITKKIVWKRADELSISDRILSVIDNRIEDFEYVDFHNEIASVNKNNRHRKHIKSEKIKITNQFLELLGIYAADGSLCNTNCDGIDFTLNLNDDMVCNKVVRYVTEIFGIDPYIEKIEEHNRLNVRVCSTEVYSIFNSMFGDGALNKNIPDFILSLNPKKQMQFIKGLFNGDGSLNKNEPKITFCTISKKLTLQVIDILERNCIKVSSYHSKPKIDKNGVHHRKAYIVDINKQCFRDYWEVFRVGEFEYDFDWEQNVSWKSKKPVLIEGIKYHHKKINKISKQKYNGYVYCLNVNKTPSFKLESVSVHNCLAGWKYDDAADIWLDVWHHFGNSFFLEYQTHNTDQQKEINRQIYQMSKKYGIQTIIGLDTHYIDEEDCIKRDNLLKRKGLHYDEENNWYMDFPDGYEVLRRMREQGVIPDEEILYSMMNTHVFRDGCKGFEYDTKFKIPILKKYENLSYGQRCEELKKILGENYRKEELQDNAHEKAIEYEYGEASGSECADYFLDNYEMINLAKTKYNGQLTTTSRGSASSYYISKLLGFTTIDRFEAEVPIFPERFITKARILASHQMPDCDFNTSSQEPFVKASRELFGEHGCYPLLAVGTFGEKSGFKMYADVMGINPSLANEITSAIDRYNEAVKEADDEDKASIKIEDYITDPQHLKIFNDSKSYQGIIEQAKCHACGFFLFNGNPRQKDVIGYGDIRYEIGLIRCYSERTGKSTIVVNIEGGLLDSYGYVKNDILIVDVVGIIAKLYKRIGRTVPPVSELRKMVDGDQKVWDLYAKGITCCLNQCEKPGTTKKAMIYKPQTVQELAAFIAGIRPGFKSLVDGFLQRVEYSNGEQAIDDLLKDSFNYMLYQEAVMKIFSYLGIPMQDSYDTIKKISKKKLKGEALKKVEDNMKKHWLQNIGNLDNFDKIYKVIKDSARYSFNAPHALSMAFDSLYEAWVKAHYTDEFYEVTLNHYQDKGDKNKVADLIKEATQMFGYQMGTFQYGIDNSKFIVKDNKIYPSLGSIKGIGEKAVQDLYMISQCSANDFVDIYLSIKGTKVTKSIFKSLIKIGYFNQFGTVKQLLEGIEVIDDWMSNGKPKKTISKSIIKDLGVEESVVRKYATDVSQKTGKVSEVRYQIIDWVGFVKELFDVIPKDEEYDLKTLLGFQQEVLGYIEFYDDSFDSRLIVVTNLNTDYSPKFDGYCLKNRQIIELKVHKKKPKKNKDVKVSFAEQPFEEGDILYVNRFKKEPRRRKTPDGWVEVPGQFQWWIKDYNVVNL